MPATSTSYRLVRPPVVPVPAPRLDPSQQVVVDHPGGPLLVLAGPGTGKTTTLVEAVVERVRRGAEPDQVLVLTFSRKAADELRERIATRLGRTVASPAAATFHSWCWSLVRAHTPPDRALRLLSQPERDVRVRELLRGHADDEGVVRWPASVRPALLTRGFAREVAALLDRARERGLDGPSLRALGEAAQRPTWVAAGVFLDEYLDVLDARGEVDYAGLVAAATDLLADPAVALRTAERYRAVFVDEYQDTDPSQERLLQLLAGGGRDLVVVGDPDQSIYAFRGADVANILDFPDRFRTVDGVTAPTVELSVCRRSGPELRTVARRVADRLPTPGLSAPARERHRALSAAGPADGVVDVRVFASPAEEVAAIADLLRRAHLQDAVPWSQMAVLVRSGQRSLPVLRRALVAAGVPVSVASDDLPVAGDPAVAPLLTALRLAETGLAAMDVDDARLLLASPLGRATPSVLRALGRRLRDLDREAGQAVPRPATVAIRDTVVDPGEALGLPEWMTAPALRVHRLVSVAAEVLARGGTPDEALWVLWEDSGWARRLTSDAARAGARGRCATRDLDAVVALFEAAGRLEERRPRAGVATLLDELGMQDIPAAAQEERAGTPDAVRLLTAHRAKGLEWDLVVVAALQEDVWPDLRRRGSLLEADRVDATGPRPPASPGALLVDERRLFYVALTRARRRLVLTAVSAVDDAGARPSRFLDDVVDELPRPRPGAVDLLAPGSLVARLRRVLQDDATSEPLRRSAAARLAELATAADDDGLTLVPVADPRAWWGMREWTAGVAPVRDPDQPVRLSASAVAGYDACPLQWYLRREVGAADAPSAQQGFGLVIHALAKLVADGTLDRDVDVLVDRLDAVWSALGYEARWHAAREREEARAALGRLVRWLDARRDALVGAEVGFTASIGDAVLTGSADRLEVDDGGKVRVVDFKTSRTAKSKAAAATDPQLAVYQLATRHGGFTDVLPPDPPLAGAELVYLRAGLASGLPNVRTQDALAPGSGWADELVAGTAAGVRAERFPARLGDACGTCSFAGVCPAQDAGGQVVT